VCTTVLHGTIVLQYCSTRSSVQSLDRGERGLKDIQVVLRVVHFTAVHYYYLFCTVYWYKHAYCTVITTEPYLLFQRFSTRICLARHYIIGKIQLAMYFCRCHSFAWYSHPILECIQKHGIAKWPS
jgi:hypothetical protein